MKWSWLKHGVEEGDGGSKQPATHDAGEIRQRLHHSHDLGSTQIDGQPRLLTSAFILFLLPPALVILSALFSSPFYPDRGDLAQRSECSESLFTMSTTLSMKVIASGEIFKRVLRKTLIDSIDFPRANTSDSPAYICPHFSFIRLELRKRGRNGSTTGAFFSHRNNISALVVQTFRARLSVLYLYFHEKYKCFVDWGETRFTRLTFHEEYCIRLNSEFEM